MNQTNLLTVPKGFDKWGRKAENYLVDNYGEAIDRGYIQGLHVGRNKDGGVGNRGGHRIRPSADLMSSVLYLETPDRVISDRMLDPNSRTKTFQQRTSDSVKKLAYKAINDLMDKGLTRKDAESRVADSIALYGYYDKKSGTFVTEPFSGRTADSVLSGMATPYWDISVIQRVFKQPFLRGYADRLVSPVGVPNMWADLVQVFTESFEGYARLSNVARGVGEHNTSIAAKNRTGTMLSEIVNLVADYESPSPNESMIGGQPGNWLTNAVIGDRDAYMDLMLDQLMCSLYYFGNDEVGFDGLMQIANRDNTFDYYDSALPPAQVMWEDTTNKLVGATLMRMFNKLIADKMEELYFLPVDIEINCSPILYKVLKFSLLSDVYNQNNPLSIIATAQEAGNKIEGTLATKSGDSLYRAFTLKPDPMLMPNTAFNNTDEDLMFITFPKLQSALDDGNLTDIILAPTPIKRMVLPSAPGYRDGTVRTAMKRIGSLLVPVEKTVHVISGMGINSRYTP